MHESSMWHSLADDSESCHIFPDGWDPRSVHQFLPTQQSVCTHTSNWQLEFSDDKDYIDTVKVDSDKEIRSPFPRDCNSRNFIFGWTSKTWHDGNDFCRGTSHFETIQKCKEVICRQRTLSLMKSMSNKGVAALLQKSQLGNFKGDQKKMVW